MFGVCEDADGDLICDYGCGAEFSAPETTEIEETVPESSETSGTPETSEGSEITDGDEDTDASEQLEETEGELTETTSSKKNSGCNGSLNTHFCCVGLVILLAGYALCKRREQE